MHCPRLYHFVRLNNNGSVGKCGHMVNARGFDNFIELENSEWLKAIKKDMSANEWPKECVRCEQSERAKGESVRTNSIDRHRLLHRLRSDYLIVGGVLDNTCNSACQSCNSKLSTKIGSLESRNYPRINNFETFKKLPQERIVELDVNGGEPTASKNYKNILKNLPANIKVVRMNTNGSRIINEIEDLLEKNIKVIVTLSLDGIDKVHDYTRWPIQWDNYKRTVDAYLSLREKYKLLHLDFWTTVSCLNIENLPDIIDFAKEKSIPHDWAFLNSPDVLNVKYKNTFTIRARSLFPKEVGIDVNNQTQLDAFIEKQDTLRDIHIKDYFNFL